MEGRAPALPPALLPVYRPAGSDLPCVHGVPFPRPAPAPCPLAAASIRRHSDACRSCGNAQLHLGRHLPVQTPHPSPSTASRCESPSPGRTTFPTSLASSPFLMATGACRWAVLVASFLPPSCLGSPAFSPAGRPVSDRMRNQQTLNSLIPPTITGYVARACMKQTRTLGSRCVTAARIRAEVLQGGCEALAALGFRRAP